MSEPKTALVARIDPEGSVAIQKFLEDRGYQVFLAGDGRSALEAARRHVPSVLVADGVLPKLSGFQLCQEVKALAEPKRPLCALVLEAEDNYGRGRARADGIDLILHEPVVEDDLAELMTARDNPRDRVSDVLTGRSGVRDKFLKELLRGTPSRNDPIVTKISDPLTGLHHKEYMTLKLEEEFKKAQRYGYPLAVIMVEVENYADIVEAHGKAVGQEALLEVSGIFLCESRDVDSSGRVDEARFLLLLPYTDLAGGKNMADRVFQQVCTRLVRSQGEDVSIRASVGIAALPSSDVTSVDDFVERSLRAMRTASNLGGNRICAWGDGKVVEKS